MTEQLMEAELVGGPVFLFVELPTEHGPVWVNAAHISRIWKGENGPIIRLTDSGIVGTTLEEPQQVMELIQLAVEAM